MEALKLQLIHSNHLDTPILNIQKNEYSKQMWKHQASDKKWKLN